MRRNDTARDCRGRPTPAREISVFGPKQPRMNAMVLMIDNYDSFTYNLVQYFGELGEDVRVVRNDDMTLAALRKLEPDAIVISPGPCTPNEAGVSLEVIEGLSGQVPIFGV